FQAHLAARGIETLIHYPVPIPRQPAMAGVSPAECPIAAQACDEIVSLPLYPALADDDVRPVAATVRAFAAPAPVSCKDIPSACVDQRGGRVHRLPCLGNLARSGARGPDPRQPVHRLD